MESFKHGTDVKILNETIDLQYKYIDELNDKLFSIKNKKIMSDEDFSREIECSGIPIEDIEILYAIKEIIEKFHKITNDD